MLGIALLHLMFRLPAHQSLAPLEIWQNQQLFGKVELLVDAIIACFPSTDLTSYSNIAFDMDHKPCPSFVSRLLAALFVLFLNYGPARDKIASFLTQSISGVVKRDVPELQGMLRLRGDSFEDLKQIALDWLAARNEHVFAVGAQDHCDLLVPYLKVFVDIT